MTKPIVGTTKERQRIDAMARVFAKTDRVLSGSPIEVTVEDSPYIGAPSWTDGRTITFNKGLIGNVTTLEDIIRLSGLNYHELAHVLYTPRTGSKIVKAIQAEGLHGAFNVLEDQRIETFLTSIYPSTIPYLVSTFVRYCIQDDSSWESNFVLMHGRRYLPSDIRREFRRRFTRPDLLPAFEAIIDEYRKLVYPTDGDRGLELTREFQQLLDRIHPVSDPHGHSNSPIGRPEINSGRPFPVQDQRNAAESVDEADQELEERDREREDAKGNSDVDDSDDTDSDDNGEGQGQDSDGHEDDGEGNSSSGSGDDSGLDDSATSDDSDADQDSDVESFQGTGDIDSATPGGNGAGLGASDVAPSKQELLDQLQDVVKEFEQSDEVLEDAADKQRSIVQGSDGIDSDLDKGRFKELLVYPEDVSVVRRFATVLERLSSDSDPGWETHASSGRVSMKRVMEGAEYDQVWDRWEEGNNDATDIECVIAIDTSGSMTYTINQASRALWVIKRALESLDANVTVITFGAESKVAYKRSDRASRTHYRALNAGGTTWARAAVRDATGILEASSRHNKIFISITDGMWNPEGSGELSSDQLIASMNKIGVTTAIAYLGMWGAIPDTHNCQIATSVNTPVELIDFAKKLVSQTFAPGKVVA